MKAGVDLLGQPIKDGDLVLYSPTFFSENAVKLKFGKVLPIKHLLEGERKRQLIQRIPPTYLDMVTGKRKRHMPIRVYNDQIIQVNDYSKEVLKKYKE